MIQHELNVPTHGRGFTRLDPIINRWLATTGISKGALHLTCLHTSASLTINENADPRVLQDLSDWMRDIVPESRRYSHDDEGADDMPAHIRTALTSQTLSLSFCSSLRRQCRKAPPALLNVGTLMLLLRLLSLLSVLSWLVDGWQDERAAAKPSDRHVLQQHADLVAEARGVQHRVDDEQASGGVGGPGARHI